MSGILILNNPIKKDYSNIYSQFLSKLYPDIKLIDILIISQISNSDDLNFILSDIYSTIRSKATKLGLDYTFEINVIFNKLDVNVDQYTIVLKSNDVSVEKYEGVKSLDELIVEKQHIDNHKKSDNTFQNFPVVAVGGTFDHMHDGHKILLSMASFLTSKTLIVGITGPKLLVNKKYKEYLESYHVREATVKSFITKISSETIALDCYMIEDVCGPTGFIKEIDALIVSAESAKGGDFVNNFRKEKEFPPLKIIKIEVIGGQGNEENNWEGKLSSTDIRKEESMKKQ